jgi:HD-GYP domain-containing protein (c-di-GMP phosphodiesterase class II)
VKTVREVFRNFETKKRIDLKTVQETVNNLIDEVLSNRDLLMNFSDIRSYDDYTFCHSVQVCVLSIITGLSMGLDQLKLKELGAGALIHDIGKTRLRANREMSLLSAHIAFQHHERWDGQGYPRGLRGEEIHPYSRIVSVADVFDALVADRPYRKAFSTNQAISLMRRMSGTQFEPTILEVLISNIAEFPIGSVVTLSSGEIAVVVDTNKEKPTQPVVRVVFNKRWKPLTTVREIDLIKDTSVQISRILTEAEVSQLFKGVLPDKQTATIS